ncbi:MAG: ethanolamine utilization protein EutN [Candidatus Riflebacteria bacterium]|nr:ethanolamine utilization protein EutN [Candidatus Riflebacteria bacterium]
MIIGKVSGTVVCTRKVDGLSGFKLLVIKKLDLARKETGDFVVAVDVVGAGHGETVLVVSGSSSRQTARTDKKPVDAAVIGIIDSVTLDKQG